MEKRPKQFLPLQGDYENLIVYKIAKCIYAITWYFANTYLEKGDRTRDQMIQAARSGKQNIAEGSVDGATSREMEIKLFNVARGSMHELKADYEDYLLCRGLCRWGQDDARAVKARRYCREHNRAEDYIEAVKKRTDETTANIVLTLLHQYDVLMVGLIEEAKHHFLTEEGAKEEMLRARRLYRDGKI